MSVKNKQSKVASAQIVCLKFRGQKSKPRSLSVKSSLRFGQKKNICLERMQRLHLLNDAATDHLYRSTSTFWAGSKVFDRLASICLGPEVNGESQSHSVPRETSSLTLNSLGQTQTLWHHLNLIVA